MATEKRSRKEWAVLIDEMKASGLNQTEWCRLQGINYKTMRSMKDKIENGKKGGLPPGKTNAKAVDVNADIPQFVQLPQRQSSQGLAAADNAQALSISVAGYMITIGPCP